MLSVSRVDPSSQVRRRGAAAAAMDRDLIVDAMARLGVEHRAAIRRSFYEGRTVAQIAMDLGVDERIVMSRLHYGVRKLLLTLEECGVTSDRGDDCQRRQY